ncbi:MAG: DUF4349 domain-containing protein [Armatimonadetes bacterium]|nr:DUF4349 domain-containing protein [Armatimonadota bacterium]
MNCRMVKSEIKAYIDGELGRVMRWRVSRHLASCVECQMEAKSMTDLTNEVNNISDITAPSGLREKVLGKLNFEPVVRAGWKWPYKTRPIAVAGLLAIAIVAAAVVIPMFGPAKVQSRKIASAGKMQAKTEQTAATRPEESLKFDTPADTISAKVDNFIYNKAPDHAPMIAVGKTVPARNAAKFSDGHINPQLMIIKNAEMTVLVKDFSKANDAAVFVAKSLGGFVTDSSVSSDEGAPVSGSMCLQVPVDSFENAIEKLGKLGKVTVKNLTGEDVTGQVVDIDSRLRNKRAEERQYLEVMNKARRIGDIMNVSNELYRVRGEIEEMAGQIKQLKSSAAMSTINLTLTEKPKPKAAPMGFIQKSFTGAVASLVGSLSKIAGIIIWLVVYSPFWGLPVFGYLYWRRRTPIAGTNEA